MTMSPALMAFFEESDSHIEIAESTLLELENNSDDLDLINELFRVTHSIKGNAGLVGLTDIHEVATDMESILDTLRAKKTAVETAQQEKLFELFDKIKSLVDIARGGDGDASVATEAVIEKSEPSSADAKDDDDFSFDAPAEKPSIEDKKSVEVEKKSEPKAEPVATKAKPTAPQVKKEKKEPAPSKSTKKIGGNADKKVVAKDESYLTFYLGEEQYGVDINVVREIILKRKITKVPNASHFLTGVMNLRGMVIPVIHAKKRLNFADSKGSEMDGENIIVVETEGVQSGIMVDRVDDITKFKPDMLVSSDSALGGMVCEFIAKLGKVEDKTVMLVDVVAFCNTREKFY